MSSPVPCIARTSEICLFAKEYQQRRLYCLQREEEVQIVGNDDSFGQLSEHVMRETGRDIVKIMVSQLKMTRIYDLFTQ